ncbi:hypothetical protein DMUE_1874 [Dictyocoela muelleri]|nr:hypothetical protein DMUE_1874 [Dictyocoela muelleri]
MDWKREYFIATNALKLVIWLWIVIYRANILFNDNENHANLDMRIVRMNGKTMKVLFDTWSSLNIITKNYIKTFENTEIKKKLDSPISIKLLNRTSIKSDLKAKLVVIYQNKKIHENFFIIDNGIVDIIIGRGLIKKFENKVFPDECCIKVEENSIVSWTRPVKNIKEKNDFQKLIAEYEKKGYLEKSRSMWLNPVVLNRKISGYLRFTLDFRRVNDLYDQDQFEIPNIYEIVKSLHKEIFFSSGSRRRILPGPLCEADRDKITLWIRVTS